LFALACGEVQDAQILPVCFRRALLDQGVVGHAEMARRKEFLPVTVLGEGARLAHQPVDHMPVVDALPVPPPQPRQMLNQLLRVPHFQVLHVEANFHFLAD
jgi:hypothetical protein